MDRQSPKRIDFLDYIRGIAILAVFLFHSLGAAYGHDQLPWNGWIRSFAAPRSFVALLPVMFGWAGVAVFFVVSGFCIHISHRSGQRKGERGWSTFFTRRFFRIYPPYLLALLLFALLLPSTRLTFQSMADWLQLGSHLLLIHNAADSTFLGINAAFWSIAVEVQLYLLYPLLLAIVDKIGWRRTLWLLGVVECSVRGVSGIVFAVTGADTPRWFNSSPLAFWFSWTLGAALAEGYVENRALILSKSSPFLFLSLAIGSNFVKPLTPFQFPLFALATAAAIAGLLSGTRWRVPVPRFWVEHLRVAGIWSYSIYLLHQPLLHVIAGASSLLTREPHPLLVFSLCVSSWLLILPLSNLWYRVVELPSIEQGKRVLALRRLAPGL